MKPNKTFTLNILFCFLFTWVVSAQFPSGYGWKVPRKSPKANTEQIVGVTTIKVEYSRPSARDREIWGGEEGIVPFNKVWRAGANEATTISFDTDVQIDSVIIKKGKYALFIIPNSTNSWKLILNKKHNQWGAFRYNEEYDVLRVDIKTNEIKDQESLLFSFSELEEDKTILSLDWGKKRIDIPIVVDLNITTKKATATAFDWSAGFFAAQYYLDETNDFEEALKWVNASLALKTNNLSSLYQKVTILVKKDDLKSAKEVAEKLIKIASTKSDKAGKYFSNKTKALFESLKNSID